MSAIAEKANDNDKGKEEPLAAEQQIIDHIAEISKNSRTTFYALIIACIYSFLTISTTQDTALLTDARTTALPIIQVKVSIVWFYNVAPIILCGLFLYFHFYMERFWRAIIRLPLYHHGDDRSIDDYLYPWLIATTFIRGCAKLKNKSWLAQIEYWLSLCLAWWFIPGVLLMYWARYLSAHEWGGTFRHVFLIVISVGFAFRFYYLAKNAVLAVPDKNCRPPDEKSALKFTLPQIAISVTSTALLGGVVTYLSLSAIWGLPADACRKVTTDRDCRLYMPGTALLSWLQIKPFADIGGQRLVNKPENWQDLMEDPLALKRYLETQRTVSLSKRNLRHLYAQNAFFPDSHITESNLDYADLQHAVLTFSALADVSLRGAKLVHVHLQHAKITSVNFENVHADVARFNNATFITSGDGEKTYFSGDYYHAQFVNSTGNNLHFQSANLRETDFKEAKIGWSHFDNVDLAGALLKDAELLNNSFVKTDFSDAQIHNADLSYSKFRECTFVSTRIKDVNMEVAELNASRFDSSQIIPAKTDAIEDQPEVSLSQNPLDALSAFGIKLKDSQIQNTHFQTADFRRAQFENVKFSNTKFSDTDFSDAVFKSTDFSGVEFVNADFSGADLMDVSGLSSNHLKNICGNSRTKLPPGYKEVEPCVN